ncbi:hypothetical protein [Paenibacillus sp. QZ-Y1]|uniref:hypothetical protein n=1 Tax=Paenibacillus sp. QZ-Y1 TaxID=3414511 RepID=UPI003F791D2A
MKELLPYIIPSLAFILNLIIFLVGRRDKKEEKKEKRLKEAKEKHKEGEQLPPRSNTHR